MSEVNLNEYDVSYTITSRGTVRIKASTPESASEILMGLHLGDFLEPIDTEVVVTSVDLADTETPDPQLPAKLVPRSETGSDITPIIRTVEQDGKD